MLNTFKSIGRTVIPRPLFRFFQPWYHGFFAMIASWYFGKSSQKLHVIGVTGTAGKSTTVMMLAHILNQTGHKTGYITTVSSSDGTTVRMNTHGLSMPDGWLIQKQLHEMVVAGCEYAIVECTSEGLAQNRHLGIRFQGALFTNLSPAHLDSHGSFDNYRAAKGRLFHAVIPQGTIGANFDDPNRNYFLQFPVAHKFGVSTRTDMVPPFGIAAFLADPVLVTDVITFQVQHISFRLQLVGTFNVTNALLAIGYAATRGVTLEQSSAGLATFGTVAGRMETVGTYHDARIIVDYACEPDPLLASLRAVEQLKPKRLIHVFGSTGGHRDVAKRSIFGEHSAHHADISIITNDDVYDSDPNVIAQNIREGIGRVPAAEKKTRQVLTILNRRDAMKHALTLAEPGDIILITGKGSEQFLVLPGDTRIPWDEGTVVKELINDLS